MGIARSLLRVLAIVGKELVEVVRRPAAIVSLVFGPFLIMALFGIGYDGSKRPWDTIVVVPPTSGLPADSATYQTLAGGGLRIVEVTPDRSAAEAALAAQQVDVVVVAPVDPEGRFRAGQRSSIQVVVDVVDPVAANYAGFLAAGLGDAVNRDILRRAASEGQGYALAAGQGEASRIPPDVVAEPVEATLVNIAPTSPGVVAFYGPAVLALILQHLAATLIALSLARERTSGMLELLRIAPVRTSELLAGKLVAYGLIAGGIATVTVALLAVAFHVPVLGDPAIVAGVIGLLIVASLGLGLLIAVLSDTERQAVQLSLLLLLASVFFSGFVLAVEEFSPAVRAVAYSLPVTHAIRLLGDLMLRGRTTVAWEIAALGAIAVATLLASWAIFRRSIRRA